VGQRCAGFNQDSSPYQCSRLQVRQQELQVPGGGSARND
jgi:hypothetical protein